VCRYNPWIVYVSGSCAAVHLIQESAEWGVPYWLAGYTSLIPLPNDRILAAHGPPHLHCLTVIDAAAATFADIPSDYTSITHSFSVSADRSRAYAIAAGAHTPYCLIQLDLAKAAVTSVIDSIIPPCKPEFLPVPRALCISGTGGRNVHAILHPATHPEFSAAGPAPLIVTAHGGPTSAATAALRLKFAYVLPASPAKVLALIISSTPAVTSRLEASVWWTSTTPALRVTAGRTATRCVGSGG
jgi:hypothetical protein